MDMSDIRETESRIEVKAAAASNLLNSINRNAFGLTLEGVLGNGSYEEQKQAAYDWMNEYYELVSAVIYSASDHAEDVYTGICDIYVMLPNFEKEAVV